MSAPGSHIVGQLVKKALTLSRNRYKSGPWEVVSTGHNLGGTYDRVWAHMTLHHYGTKMLEWNYYPAAKRVEMLGTWTGIGSTSDQTGVNSALMALGSPLRYSRVGVRKKVGGRLTDVDPSAARINPPTFYQAVALLRHVGMSLSKRGREYRVAFRGPGNEHTAYYTTDLSDAMHTGADMARRAGLSGAFRRRA